MDEQNFTTENFRMWKTTFVPKLAISNLFGALKKVEWIYAIELDKTRDAEIESCFEAFVDFS